MLTSVIYFWGKDLPHAKRLSVEARSNGLKAFARDASVFAGDVEPCEKVVILPCVHPLHLDRVATAYGDAGITVERLEHADAHPEPEVVTEEQPKPTKPTELHRLSNRQLLELARVRGIEIPNPDKPDRATMIAAITKESPS